MRKPCLDCGELTQNSRCDPCRIEHERPAQRTKDKERDRLSPKQRGYDSAWNRLSKRARQLQPWCLHCGSKENLTVDHLPQAWEKRSKGLPLSLRDVQVLCRDCNSKAGSSRPGTERAEKWQSEH